MLLPAEPLNVVFIGSVDNPSPYLPPATNPETCISSVYPGEAPFTIAPALDTAARIFANHSEARRYLRPAVILFLDYAPELREQVDASLSIVRLNDEFPGVRLLLIYCPKPVQNPEPLPEPGTPITPFEKWFLSMFDLFIGGPVSEQQAQTVKEWLERPVVPVPDLRVNSIVSGGGAAVLLTANPPEEPQAQEENSSGE